MKYSKNRKYRDQEKTIEKEIKIVRKKIKKEKPLTEKVKEFFKRFWK